LRVSGGHKKEKSIKTQASILQLAERAARPLFSTGCDVNFPWIIRSQKLAKFALPPLDGTQRNAITECVVVDFTLE